MSEPVHRKDEGEPVRQDDEGQPALEVLHQRPYRSCNLASKLSRNASPTKLNATTVAITMSPAG